MVVSQNLYELVALAARYLFAALMVLIVARAWRLTIIDSRRAKTLRRLSPETGISGELIVMAGDGKARRGMRYPVIREGLIGTSREADIRIRHSSIRRRHAYFQLTPEGLEVRSHGGARLGDVRGRPVKAITLRDGDIVTVGGIRLMLVLSEVPESEREIPDVRNRPARRQAEGRYRDDAYDEEEPYEDGLYEDEAERMFAEQPVLTHVPAPDVDEADEEEDWFDVDGE